MAKKRDIKFERVHSGQAAAQRQARFRKYQEGMQEIPGVVRQRRRREP